MMWIDILHRTPWLWKIGGSLTHVHKSVTESDQPFSTFHLRYILQEEFCGVRNIYL